MDLFLQKPSLKFEKTAAVTLDEDPEAWPRQILVELFRTLPEASDYTPRVAMMKVDEEQGYGYGVIIVENSTDSALSVARPGANARRVVIPIVIKNHELSPLDILMTRSGKMAPLNAVRLREALFRPETFEMITDDWGDTNLYNMFYPPGRSDNDFGAGISQGMGGGTQGAVTMIQGPGMKLSAADYPMLSAVAPTLLRPDLTGLAKIAEKEPAILEGVNPVMTHALLLLSAAEKTATHRSDEVFNTALSAASADVVQCGYADGSYWVKAASRSALHDTAPVLMSRARFLKFAGDDVTRRVDTEGTVTVAGGAMKIDTDSSKWVRVDTPGIYKVKTVHGKEMTGWVLPNLVDLDGSRVPMAVFTNGAAAVVQGQIAGARVAEGVDLPSAPPKGTGCFYMAGQGGVEATVPLLVQGGEAELGGGDSWLCRSLTGEHTRVRMVPGLKVMQVLKGEFLLPASAKFLPLENESLVALVEEPEAATKTAAEVSRASIRLGGWDGETFQLELRGLPKLASVTSKSLSYDDAVFVLCLAGADAAHANKIAAASMDNPVAVTGFNDVKLARDIASGTRKIAAENSAAVMSLRRELVKEAAAMPSSMTVDAVLSLGLINSENVHLYISRIPYFEKCLSMLCELVLGSRVGLSEVPEAAAARAARGLDDVIQGLKALSLRDLSGT
jgi:hypothetical protein